MLHFVSGFVSLAVLAISIAAVIATIKAEMASIRRVLGSAFPEAARPPAYKARFRMVRKAEFRPVRPMRARAA